MSFQKNLDHKTLILGRMLNVAPAGRERAARPNVHNAPETANLERPTPLIGQEPLGVVADGHLLTLTAGNPQFVDAVLIPNLMSYGGSVVVLDPTGELYAKTANTRRAMGQAVLRLDPFRIGREHPAAADPFAPPHNESTSPGEEPGPSAVEGFKSDGLNPIDLLDLPNIDYDAQCQLIADMVSPRLSLNDFWENCAFNLLTAIIAYVHCVPEKRRFTEVVKACLSDDVVYNLAVVLDTIGKRISPTAYSQINAFLQTSDADRARILATVTSRLQTLVGEAAVAALDQSTIPVEQIASGAPLTAYLTIPRDKQRSHGVILRLWLGSLLHLLSRVSGNDGPPALFLLTADGPIEQMNALELALTQHWSGGPILWSFWNDLAQLRRRYPVEWPTMLQASKVVQILDPGDYPAAMEAAAAFGLEWSDLRISAREVLLNVDGNWYLAQRW